MTAGRAPRHALVSTVNEFIHRHMDAGAPPRPRRRLSRLDEIDVSRRFGAAGGLDRANALYMVVQRLVELVLQAEQRAAYLGVEPRRGEVAQDFPIRVAEHNLLEGPVACARFYRRRLIEQAGPLDLRYEFCAGRDLLLRLLIRGVTAAQLDRPGYYYRHHATSRTLAPDRATKRRINLDHLAMARRHLAVLDLPPDARRWLRRFHAVECAKAVLRSASPAAALPLLAQGFQVSPAFPAVAVTSHLRVRFRHGRGKSPPMPAPP